MYLETFILILYEVKILIKNPSTETGVGGRNSSSW